MAEDPGGEAEGGGHVEGPPPVQLAGGVGQRGDRHSLGKGQ